MAMFMRIESVQVAECFDCGERRRVYGVQKVVRFKGVKAESQPDGSAKVQLPPLPDGWSWESTCKRCGKKLEKQLAKEQEE